MSVISSARENALWTIAHKNLASTTYFEAGISSLAALMTLEKISRVECVDISHMGGKSAYGSVVVWENGALNKKRYRAYKLVATHAGDDYASMGELISRRYMDNIPPDVLIIDGGEVHLNYLADQVLKNATLRVKMSPGMMLGIVKAKSRKSVLDRIVIGHPRKYLCFDEARDIFAFVQKLRDEAHRFAHKAMSRDKGNSIKPSQRSKIPGIGGRRMQLLMTNFGDMNILAKATMAQLDAIPGIGSAIALDIWKYFHQDEPSK